jgi:hypothetical protein
MCFYILADSAQEYEAAVLDCTRGYENVHANGADRCTIGGRIMGMVRAWNPIGIALSPQEDHE